MTLKQFFQVGGGALVAVLIYASHLYPIIKWPLMIFSFALGAAMAFLPFEERPLSRWIFAFFSSIYSPTIFFWKRSESVPEFFLPDEGSGVASSVPLPTTPSPKGTSDAKLDQKEEGFLLKIGNIFGQLGTMTIPVPTKPETEKPEETLQKPPVEKLVIPTVPMITVSPQSKGFRPKIVVEEKETEKDVDKVYVTSNVSSPVLTGIKTPESQQAQFSSEAAPPIPPSIPNTISGQVFDDKGKIVEGAILEIRDLAGRPVRALRSNKVGHFLIVTALQNGQYDVVSEKEGLLFDPVTFEAKGDIIPPIVIRAKGSAEVKNVPYAGKPLIIN